METCLKETNSKLNFMKTQFDQSQRIYNLSREETTSIQSELNDLRKVLVNTQDSKDVINRQTQELKIINKNSQREIITLKK